MLIELKAKIKGRKYLPFEQDGETYNLYDMPKGFVIKGNLDLSNKSLTELPDLSEVVVKGGFYCFKNQLTSLKGAPKEIGGSFDCSWNNLTSLEGAPQTVSERFDCSGNQLTTLEGAPQTVGGDFFCSKNRLTSLEGAPKKVGRSFYCYDNKLTSLEGASKEVGRDFYCYGNKLTSLEGAPQRVGGGFNCTDNQLTSLVGLPQMEESMKIRCDDSLGNKYGFSDTCNNGVSYEQLCASPVYKSEDAMNRVRSKLPQENIETKPVSTKQQEKTEIKTKQQEAFEKINAEFSQWLKDNSAKPTRQ